ncbi:MAG: hypothetical protein JWM62_2475, partial [Frankiales bacterium]|nr:hypothetical protein [Frankiales bacterium]
MLGFVGVDDDVGAEHLLDLLPPFFGGVGSGRRAVVRGDG